MINIIAQSTILMFIIISLGYVNKCSNKGILNVNVFISIVVYILCVIIINLTN